VASSQITSTIASSGSATVVADPREGKDGYVMQVVTTSGGIDKLTLVPAAVSSTTPTCLVTELDLCFVNNGSSAVRTRIICGDYFTVDVRFEKDMIKLRKRDASTYFSELAYGEWFNIRIENYLNGDSAGTVLVYVNDVLVATDVATKAEAELTKLEVNILKDASHTVYVDNMRADATNDTYQAPASEE